MSSGGEETELFALFDGFMNLCFQGTDGSQQLASEQKSSSQTQSTASQPWNASWKQFKNIIAQRPINYHQFFTFISKIQENTSTPTASQQQTDLASESSNLHPRSKNQQKANNPRVSAGPSITSSQNIFSSQNPSASNLNQHSGLAAKTSNSDAFLGTNLGMFKTAGGNLQSNMIKNSNNKKATTTATQAAIQSLNAQNDSNNHALASMKEYNMINGQDPEKKEGRIVKDNQQNQMNTNLKNDGRGTITAEDGSIESRNAEKNTFNIYNTDLSEQQSPQQFPTQTYQQSPDKLAKKPSSLASHKSPQQQATLLHPSSLHQSQNSTTTNSRTGLQQPNQNSIHSANYLNTQAKQISNNLRSGETTGIIQTSTFVSQDRSVFSLRNFSDFLRTNTLISSLGKNTQFENTSIVCLANSSNSQLKLIAINFFVNLFKELPHPELSPSMTCQNSKHFLLEILSNVQSGNLLLSLPHNAILSIQQISHAFISNIGLLLQLYFLHGQHPFKLATALIFQINNDPILLDSLLSVVKALLIQQVHRSSNDIILQFFKLPDSVNKDQKTTIDQILQDEKKQIVKRMKSPENWRNINQEWLFLLSFALRRFIELFTLRENKLDQIQFSSKKLMLSDVVVRNKINLFSTVPIDQKYQVTYVLVNSQQDKQIYASIAGTMDKHSLRLDEELNLPYVLKQIAKEVDGKITGKEQIPMEKLKQPGVVGNSMHSNLVQSEHTVGFDSSNDGLSSLSQPAILTSGQQLMQNNRKSHTQTTLPSSAGTGTATAAGSSHPGQVDQISKEYQPGGYRSRQPGTQGNLQITQIQQQQQQQQQARMEASGRLSHGIKSQNASLQPSSQLNGLASPQLQKGNPATSPRIDALVAPPPRLSTNNREENDWNKPALQTKLKDLLFTLHIHSDQLNSLGKFPISSAITNQQQLQQVHTQLNKSPENPIFAKEMNQPASSPKKLKSILHPLQPAEENNMHNNNNNNNNSKHNNTNNNTSSSQASTKHTSSLASQLSNGLSQTAMSSQVPNNNNPTGLIGSQQNRQSFQQYQQQQQIQQQQQLYSSNQYSHSQNDRFKMFRSTNNNNTTTSESNNYSGNYHPSGYGMNASQNANMPNSLGSNNIGLLQQQHSSAFQTSQGINNLTGNTSAANGLVNSFKRPNSIEGTSSKQQQQIYLNQQQQQQQQGIQFSQQQQSQSMYPNHSQQQYQQQRELSTKLSPRQQQNYNNNNNNNLNAVSH